MNIDDIKQDRQYSHRTQISLSKAMYRQLMANKGDLSLAEYVRQLIMQAWQEQVRRQARREEVAKLLQQPMQQASPSVQELLQKERRLRQDRDDNDDINLNRLKNLPTVNNSSLKRK